MNLSLSEQIMHCAVRLELPESGGAGTGFYYSFFSTSTQSFLTIVTNRHVVEGKNVVKMKLNKRDDENRYDQWTTFDFEISNAQQRIVYHDSEDLALIIIGDIFSENASSGNRPFHITLDRDLIPTPAVVRDLSPLENIVTAGFPGSFWDHVNNIPLFHSGKTASPISKNFRGQRAFVVDFATWPGASGSPVFILNEGFMFNARTGSTSLGNSRLLFIGVVYGVAVQEVTGKVVIKDAPTLILPTPLSSSSNVPTNIGACLQSSLLFDMERKLIALGVKSPDGYEVRVA